MPAMPLLFRRKSVRELARDPVNSDSTRNRSAHQRPPTAAAVNTNKDRLAPARSASPPRPVSENGYAAFGSPRAHNLHPDDASGRPKSRRFSIMKFRNFSESNLHARLEDDPPPPMPTLSRDESPVPAIIRSAPTMDGVNRIGRPELEQDSESIQEDRQARGSRFKRASAHAPAYQGRGMRNSMEEKRSEKTSKPLSLRWRKQGKSGLEDLHRYSTMNLRASQHLAPPVYGDESDSLPAVPVMHLATEPRFSESSRSDGSSADIYASTTTTHTVSTHTTFFKLSKRNKNRNSLFPVPGPSLPNNGPPMPTREGPSTPRASTSALSTHSYTPGTSHTTEEELKTSPSLQRRHTEVGSPRRSRRRSAAVPPHVALARGSLSFAEPGMNLFRQPSRRSHHSATSSPLQPPTRLGMRDRASTTSSFGRPSQDRETPPPPMSASGRTSTSTLNRASFGGLLTLSRFRQGSEPHSPRHGSPGGLSKTNSFIDSREALIIPEREEGDTPGKYLERLEEAVSRSLIAGILSKSADAFAQAVLRSYTRRFPFFGEPIDMSLRKFLLEAELPKETQQVDRVIQAFADRYHECNPGIFVAPDQAYVIAFSIMMLHTDAFNKNNKRKMQKQDYIKNTSGQGVSDDILACFYDNICYTPFVHYDEEDIDVAGDKVFPFTNKPGEQRGKLKSAIPGADGVISKKPAGPIDPYNLLVDQKLDTLRPPIKESMTLEDPYHFTRTPGEIDMNYLQRAFTHTGHLQIISARSRPAAYENHQNNLHPNETETQQGIVDLKITKVGVLWRKAAKKKKTRSPWSEWGAVLTGSQLYLFKNVHWAKGLIHQFTSHQRVGQSRTPVIFKPPLSDFKPDSLLKIDHAVALVDSTYTRHKHAFTFVRMNGQEEVFLADNESELNDWLGLINYAAAFRAAGVRIRGMIGNIDDDARSKAAQQLSERQAEETDGDKQAEASAALSESIVTLNRGLSPQLQRQVMAARRQIIVQKMSEIEAELGDANQRLDGLLRNGRHLLVLAPIPPKSREDVVHAAAQTDASLTWLRRDIWRLKAQMEFLSLDLKLDRVDEKGDAEAVDAVSRSNTLQRQQLQRSANEPVSTKVLETSEISAGTRAPYDTQLSRQLSVQTSDLRAERPTLVPRFSSFQDGASLGKSPQSLQSLSAASRSTSIDDWMTSDVFRTPSESTLTTPTRDGIWQLPPLNLESDSLFEHQKRPSIASTTQQSVSSYGPANAGTKAKPTAPSITRTSSRISTDVTTSPQSIRPTISSFEAKEVERLARAALSPESTPPPSINQTAMAGVSPADTLTNSSASRPQHQSRLSTGGAVRRSLHKTLRDSHVHNSAHKHRRGRDSDSTLRSVVPGSNASVTAGSDDKEGDAESDAAVAAAQAAQAAAQATPGLTRDKPRFILHGKQASVVQFGGDWERMRLRREAYGREHDRESLTSSNAAAAAAVAATEGKEHDGRAGSLSVRGSFYDEGSDDGARSDGFREDAEVAATFASTAMAMKADEDANEEQYFDSLTGSPTESNAAARKRQTVLGPVLSQQFRSATTTSHSSPQEEESSAESDSDSDADDGLTANRPRTASSSVHPQHLTTGTSTAALHRFAQHSEDGRNSDEDSDEDDDDDDDEQAMMTPIDDMELWRLSQI